MRNGSTPKTLQTELGDGRDPARRAIATASFAPQLVAKRQTPLGRPGREDPRSLRGRDEHARYRRAPRPSSTASRSAATRSAASPTPSWTTSRRGARGRWRTSIRSSTSTPGREGPRGPRRPKPRLLPRRRRHRATASARRSGSGGSETEGAKFWLAVLNDLHRRGVRDVLICCVDGLKGFPDAIEAVFPQAWVQTCIVHQIRACLRYVNYRDRKRVAAALRPIYTAANADDASPSSSTSTRLGRAIPDDHRGLASAGNTSSRSSRCPPRCATPSTPPTASRPSTARSARRSRPAATSPTNTPPPS